MTTIEFFPSKSYSIRRYTLTRDGAEIGQIDCGGVRGTAAIVLSSVPGGATYTPVIDSVVRGKFHLEANGTPIAGAQAAGFWFRYFNVQAGTRSYTLTMASWFGRRFALMENGTELGRIGVTNAFSGRCKAELPDDLPLEVQAFLIWLVISTWRRAAAATVVAGTAAGG
jgi:hypothetical protein